MPAHREHVELDAPGDRGNQRLEMGAIADDHELAGRLGQPDRRRGVDSCEHGEAGGSVSPELPVVDQACGGGEESIVGDLLRSARHQAAKAHRVLRHLPTRRVSR